MANVQVREFKHEIAGTELSLKTIDLDGEIMFVGKDVAGAMGYKNANDALTKHIDDEDKVRIKNLTLPSEMLGSDIASKLGIKQGRTDNVILINESGLYSLIFSSQKEEAKIMKRWVTKEVLPSIRRYGSYTLGEENLPQELREEHQRNVQKSVKEITEKYNKVLAENEELKSDIKELKEEKKELREDIKWLKVEKREVDKKNEILTSSVASLTDMANNYKKEKNEITKIASAFFVSYGEEDETGYALGTYEAAAVITDHINNTSGIPYYAIDNARVLQALYRMEYIERKPSTTGYRVIENDKTFGKLINARKFHNQSANNKKPHFTEDGINALAREIVIDDINYNGYRLNQDQCDAIIDAMNKFHGVFVHRIMPD